MAKKKTAPKKAAPKKTAKKSRALTKAEAFYVESHYGKKDAAELAAELGAPKASVAGYLAELKEAGWEAPEKRKKKSGIEKAGFAVKDGTVSMTPTSSEKGDEHRGVTVDGTKPARRNEEFFRRRGGGIHVIDPNRPVR